MTQEVIVYRNPFEAAMWNGLSMIPFEFWVAFLATFVVFLLVAHMTQDFTNKLRRNGVCERFLYSWQGWVVFAVAITAGVGTGYIVYNLL